MGKILFFLAFFVFICLCATIKYDADLMDQCMNDGKKEYECRAMLRGHSH